MANHVISFISAKGGSGKTVTASSIGRFLARLGYRTLLVDTDASTNGLTLLFLPTVTRSKSSRTKLAAGVFDVDPFDAPKVIKIEDRLDIAPSTYTMAETEGTPIEKFENTLKSFISQSGDYDFILLDAQAGTDTYAKVAASVADQVVIVTEFDPISLQGVDRLKIFFSSVLEPSNTWVLYNKILPEFATAIGEGLIIAQVLPPIPWDVDVVRAFAQRELAINMAEPNPYTIAIGQIAGRLCGEKVKAHVAKWMTTTEHARMLPITNRLTELETEIEQLLKAKIAVELRNRNTRRIPLQAAVAVGSVGVGLSPFLLTGLSDFLSKMLSQVNTSGPVFLNLSTIEPVILMVFVAASAFSAWIVASAVTRQREQKGLETEQFISRRLDDLNEERTRLKVTADASVIDRRRTATA